jgi:hypothetical protein
MEVKVANKTPYPAGNGKSLDVSAIRRHLRTDEEEAVRWLIVYRSKPITEYMKLSLGPSLSGRWHQARNKVLDFVINNSRLPNAIEFKHVDPLLANMSKQILRHGRGYPLESLYEAMGFKEWTVNTGSKMPDSHQASQTASIASQFPDSLRVGKAESFGVLSRAPPGWWNKNRARSMLHAVIATTDFTMLYGRMPSVNEIRYGLGLNGFCEANSLASENSSTGIEHLQSALRPWVGMWRARGEPSFRKFTQDIEKLNSRNALDVEYAVIANRLADSMIPGDAKADAPEKLLSLSNVDRIELLIVKRPWPSAISAMLR